MEDKRTKAQLLEEIGTLQKYVEKLERKRKRMKERMARERELLQGLLNEIPDVIYFKDDRNRLIMVNKAHAAGLGLEPEDVVGKTDFDFFPKEEARKMWEDDNWVMATHRPLTDRMEKTTQPNGSKHVVSTTKIPRFDKEGRVIGTMGITRDITERMRLEEERLDAIRHTVSALAKAVELRDLYTFGHAAGVAAIVESVARKLKWAEERIEGMRMAGELHDIGKIAVPAEILSKPARLSELEYGIVREHPKKSYEILKDIKFPFPLAEAIYQHHERLDGTGYPRGLSGEEVGMEARILGCADVLEAMTLHRPYRQALGLEKALEELREGAGTRYDSSIVDLVLSLMDENGHQPFWIKR